MRRDAKYRAYFMQGACEDRVRMEIYAQFVSDIGEIRNE